MKIIDYNYCSPISVEQIAKSFNLEISKLTHDDLEGIFEFQEYYPNALEETYKGISGYIYKTSDIPNINYDYYIPMMDLPIVCNTTPETIPQAKGYLKVSKAKINAYKKKYIDFITLA